MKRIMLFLFLVVLIIGCKKESVKKVKELKEKSESSSQNLDFSKFKVTFIELGSVNCVPCKMMQPVMKQVEEKYKGQVNVVFYDVWTEKDAPMAEKYQIQVIPTQVFLDSNGVEFSRHQGFFPFEELEKILKQQGVN
ncbi:MAG TPA: thioredoxin family protein [Spirochaetota bacterium]|nr:thioredoxin family protein [Spirochaetota bacterium]